MLFISDKGKEKFVSLSIYFVLIILSINILNIIFLVPIFLFYFKNTLIFYLLSTNIFFITILTTLFYRNIRNIEKLNNDLLEKSVDKSDFINYLTNDIFFNIKFSLISSLSILSYLLVLYIPLIFLLNLSFIKLFLNIGSVFFVVTFFLLSFNLLVYLLNRNIDKTFFEFHNYKNTDNIKLLINISILILVFIITSFALSFFIKKLIIVFTIGFILSIIITLILSFVIKKFDLLNKSRAILMSKKFNKIFFKDHVKIENYNILNYLKSIKFLYLFIIFGGYLLCFLFLNKFLNLDFKIILFQAFVFPMFFSKSVLLRENVIKKNFDRSFIFTSVFFAILFFISFLKVIDFNGLYEVAFMGLLKPFIAPFFDLYNNFVVNKDILLKNIFILFYLAVPLLFLFVFLLSEIFYHIKSKVEFILDKKIKSKLNSSETTLLFGDSMSQYYFLSSLISNILFIFIIYMLIKPFSGMLSGLFETFQVQIIFKLNFLTNENIFKFLDMLYKILLIFVIAKLVISFFSTLLSHFMLFSNEIVYIENKIYKTTILRLPTSKINYIIVKQNILEKILDIGTIFIETQDKNGLIKISGISSIREKNIKIMERIKFDLQEI